MSHSDRSRHGWSPVPVLVVRSRPGRVLTRAEVAGLADQERKINLLYDHGDQPSDWFFRDLLAAMDTTATQEAA